MFHRLGAHAIFHRQLGFHAILQQGVIAQAGKAHGGQRGFAAHTVRGTRCLAGARLKISGQRVAHARHQQAHGGSRHDGGVYQHHIGVRRQEQIFFKHTFIRIDDAERRARRVGGGDGGHNHHRRPGIIGHGLGGVVNFAAANAHHNIAARGLKCRFHTLNLRHAALAVERLVYQAGALRGGAGRKVCFHPALAGGACQHKQLAAQQFHMLAQFLQFTGPLHIARRACHNICHFDSSFLHSGCALCAAAHRRNAVCGPCAPEYFQRNYIPAAGRNLLFNC